MLYLKKEVLMVYCNHLFYSHIKQFFFMIHASYFCRIFFMDKDISEEKFKILLFFIVLDRFSFKRNKVYVNENMK